MRLTILAACADTFFVFIDGLHFEPRCVDEFSKRRAALALRQPTDNRRQSVQGGGTMGFVGKERLKNGARV